MDKPPPFEPDPVIEAFKKDLDTSLIQENLKRTPTERLERMMATVRLVEALKAGLRKDEGR